MNDRIGGKHIGFFRLVDACDRPGCPVCTCLLDDARQYLTSLLYEQVTDPDTRGRLRRSWGFCNWHAWMLRDVPDSAFGSAIVHEDILRAAIARFEERARWPGRSRRPLVGWLARLGGRAPRSPLVTGYGRRAACPACDVLAGSETDYVRLVLRFIDDPQLDDAYARSHGVCLPHAAHALEVAAGTAAAQRLVARTLPKWEELRRDLEGFVDKHDHRNRRPFTEAESVAHLRALEVLTGARGLFGSDLRAAARIARDARSGDVVSAQPLAHPAEDHHGDRATLELRVKELSAEVERLRAELEAARSARPR